MNKNILPLLSILEAIEKIRLYSSSFITAEDFFQANAQMNFNASVSLLIAIGEEAKKIEEHLIAPEMVADWKAIKGLRDKLSHNYRGIDKDIIWDIVQTFLQPLKANCETLFLEIPIEKGVLKEISNSGYYAHLVTFLSKTLLKNS